MNSIRQSHGFDVPRGNASEIFAWARHLGVVHSTLRDVASSLTLLEGDGLHWSGTGRAACDRQATWLSSQIRSEAQHLADLGQASWNLAFALDEAGGLLRRRVGRLDDLSHEVDRARVRVLTLEGATTPEGQWDLIRARAELEAALQRYGVERRDTGEALAEANQGVVRADQVVAGLMAEDPSEPGGPAQPTELISLFTRNQGRISQHVDRLTADIRRLSIIAVMMPGLAAAVIPMILAAQAKRSMLLRWVEERRQFLDVDFEGDGRIVEVAGNLATARAVMVVVPGVGNGIWVHDRNLGGAIRTLQGVDDHVAVVAWLGYDTPGSWPLGVGPLDIDALKIDRAVHGAGDLVGFLADLDGFVATGVPITLIGHSYGSLVTAFASSESDRVTNLVLLGSPGIPLPRAALRAKCVWAATVDGDPIDEVAQLTTHPGSSDDDDQPQRLHHGWNPTHDAYGAGEIDLPASGHSGYFSSASAAVLVSIATSAHHDASRAEEGCD